MPIRPKKPKPEPAIAPSKPDLREPAPPGLVNYDQPGDLYLKARQGVSDGRVMADLVLSPVVRHSVLATEAGSRGLGGKPPATDAYESLSAQIDKAAAGDMEFASKTLAAQAASLDALFTEMAQRSRGWVGTHFDAAERFMRLALKAQSNCRTTLEALAKLHQPREQTVRHVHVNEGGQAVIAEQFHHHSGGHKNADNAIQPHEPCRAAGNSPALPSTDPRRHGVPVSGDQGAKPVPTPRRQKHRRTQG